MMIFKAPKQGLIVKINREVIDHLARFRQIKRSDNEAGGQLFARISGDTSCWVIEKATGPRRRDFRSRFGFKPNRTLEQRDIDLAFAEGLHFIGDWHTHPEPLPKPSLKDNESMSDMFDKSEHELNGFIMIIVGNDEIDELWISFHSGSGVFERLSVMEN